MGTNLEQKDINMDSVIAKCKEYYRTNAAGGCLHIVLDDENTEDHSIIFCITFAMEHEDWKAVELCGILLQMTKEERDVLVSRYSEYSHAASYRDSLDMIFPKGWTVKIDKDHVSYKG